MFLLKIKCSEVKVPHFPLKEQKVELKQTCSLRLLQICRVCFVAALMLVIEITPVLWASSCWSRCRETWPEHHVWASFRFLKSSTDLSDYWKNVFVIMDFRGSQRSEVNEDLITSRIGFAAARTSASWNQTENIKVQIIPWKVSRCMLDHPGNIRHINVTGEGPRSNLWLWWMVLHVLTAGGVLEIRH